MKNSTNTMEVNINEISEDKLPIKYILGIYKKLETYPDAFDIMYIFINEAVTRKSSNTRFTKHALIKYHSEGNIENAEEGLKRAIQLGLIEQIKDEPGKEAYNILINPFL